MAGVTEDTSARQVDISSHTQGTKAEEPEGALG
jgi:hypothetical protein